MIRLWLAAIFLLQPQAPAQVQPGVVTGRLLSVNGNPAAGVRIAAVPVLEGEKQTNPEALLGISQTDAQGRYRLENIPPGRYYIFAGLIDLPSYYPDARTLDRATAVTVDPGSTVSGIDFSMARPLTLTVTGRMAVPSTMQQGAGWTMTLMSEARGASGRSFQSEVGPNGSFEFREVSPGDYRLTSNVRGSSALNLTVIDADVKDLVMPLVDCNAGAQVSGRLVGNLTSARGSTIALAGSRVGCAFITRIESDGSFSFNNVPEGNYQFQLTPAPMGWTTSSVIVGKTNAVGIEVPLPALITIKGRARVEDGSEFPRTSRGAPLSIQAIQSNGVGVVTGPILDDGNFELTLAKGRYRISVASLPGGYYLKSMYSGLVDLSATYLEMSDAPPDIELTLGLAKRPQPSGVRVSGQLTFAATGALPNSESVLLVSASASRNVAVRESALARDGSFEFTGVPPGIYNIETFPDNPSALYGIVVNRMDVTGIEFVVPPLIKVKGGIEWADLSGAAVTDDRPSVSVQFTRREGSKVTAFGALAQAGTFHFYLPEGDYRFSVSDIPSNYDLNSVTAGDTNVLEDGLRIRPNTDPPSLRVTLRGKR